MKLVRLMQKLGEEIMAEYNLAVIPGDGVGPEVIAEGKKVLEALVGGNRGISFK